MNNQYYIQLGIALFSSSLPCITGSLRFRQLDLSSRIFYFLLVIGLLTEITAYFIAKSYRNNLAVYNISALLQVMAICLFFNYAIDKFKIRHTGWVIGVISMLVGILNMTFLQPINVPNTYYSNYQMILVILLMLTLLQNDLLPAIYTYRIRWSVHFWLAFLLTNLVILNFVCVSLYDFFLEELGKDMYVVDVTLVVANSIFNIGFAYIFFRYPQMERNYATR